MSLYVFLVCLTKEHGVPLCTPAVFTANEPKAVSPWVNASIGAVHFYSSATGRAKDPSGTITNSPRGGASGIESQRVANRRLGKFDLPGALDVFQRRLAGRDRNPRGRLRTSRQG